MDQPRYKEILGSQELLLSAEKNLVPENKALEDSQIQRGIAISSDERSRILLVDDNWDHAYLASNTLSSKLNYDVEIASSGSEALYKLAGEKYSLLILDYNLSGMSGLDLIKRISEENYLIPIVMVTGLGSEAVAVEAMKLGAYDYIVKSGDYISTLPYVVNNALERFKLKRVKEQWDNWILRRNRELRALNTVAAEIKKSLRLEEVLRSAVDQTMTVLEADCARIRLLDSHPELCFPTNSAPAVSPLTAQLPLTSQTMHQLAISSKVLLIEDTSVLTDSQWSLVNTEIRSACFIPLQFREKIIGVLALGSRKTSHFVPEDAMLLGALGNEIGGAIENAKLYEAVQWQAKKIQENVYEQKELQDQLLRSERLAVLGKFVAGIAHELNNPLASVSGFTQILLREEGLAPDIRALLQKIYDEIKRATLIMHNLLSFARERKTEQGHIDVNDLLRRTIALRAHKLDSDSIEIFQDLDPDVPWVLADALQLQLVFLNIITNAEQAMVQAHGSGRLEIRTGLKHGDFRARGEDDKYIEISFADNGAGISKENLKKVFDPFFTTKRLGEGTGLGLSIAYGIVKQHEGEITVESKEGKGTLFAVLLPIAPMEPIGM